MLKLYALNGRNQGRWRAGGALLALGSLSCGDDEGVSFARDVQPLLERNCVTCHHSDSQVGIIDIEDPFTQDDPPGLVGSDNPWAIGHPGYSDPYNVVPFDPDTSFLMRKITDENLHLGACDRDAIPECGPDVVGTFMPKEVPRLTGDEIGAIRQWITDGAEDTEFFRTSVAPIFGDPSDFRRPDPCGYCHYPGTPDPPHFMDPFDPIEGIVNVPSSFRSDLKLVEPGDPDASFLVIKIEATEYSSDVGAPMPRNYPQLSADEVSVIDRWIREGAKRN